MGKFGVNSGSERGSIAFGAFRLDAPDGRLWKGDKELRLTPRAAAVLALLAERAQQVVTKQELFARVWNGKATGDEALTSCIRELRRVLGDSARKPRYIETRHRRGYCLVVPATPGKAARRALPAMDKPTIAIMPFRNLGEGARRDSLVEGIGEDIATALSRCSDIAVIAHGSVAALADARATPADIGRQLGVRYLLMGSARRDGRRARVSVRLVDANSGEQVWADRYDSDLRDILILQADIASQIVATIAPRVIRAEERRVSRLPAKSLKAYELALLAQALACQGDGADDDVIMTRRREALRHAERALALDPASPFAHAALALAHMCLPEHQYFQPEYAHALDAAAAAAEELRRLDPASYVASYVIGKVCIRRQQGREALVNLRRAHELNPNNCDVLRALSWAEHNLGLGAEALEHCALALRLSPRDPRRYQFHWGLAWAAWVAGDTAAGADWARAALEDNPGFFGAHAILAACLAEAGDLETARQSVSHLLQHRREYIRSRLEGKNFLGVPALADRFTTALRRAAGPLADGARMHTPPLAEAHAA